MGYTAAIAGASGLVGSLLLKKLLVDEHYEKILVLARRKPELSHPKIETHLGDLRDENFYLALPPCHHLFIAIGTTRSKTPDLAQYREIDCGIPYQCGRYAQRVEAAKTVVVSSTGASPKSGSFYLRTKGQMEAHLRQLQLPGLHFLRPALILGERSENRSAEALAQTVFKVLNPILPQKYRGVKAASIAAMMLRLAGAQKAPEVVESKEIYSGQWQE